MARCFSIASRPSVLGKTMFSAAFDARGMDWTYAPLEVATDAQLRAALDTLRRDGRGCGVSMPWKTIVPALLDDLDPVAKRIGSVNTIVNDGGKLKGYNTDYSGALATYHDIVTEGMRVLVCGAGGVARAQVTALRELGADVTVASIEGADAFAATFEVRAIPWDERTSFAADMLVNCTPIGMAPDADVVVPEESLSRFRVVADMVIKPLRTRLVATAEEHGCTIVPGWRFALAQALDQFRLYTGEEPPRDVMESALRSLPNA